MRLWRWGGWGGWGGLPSPNFPSAKCSRSPAHGTREANAAIPGDRGRVPEGGRTGRVVPQHTPARPRTRPSLLLPPQRRHSHAQRCQDTSGNATLVEPRCLRQKRAPWGGAAPAPGCSQHRPFPSGKRFTPQCQERCPAQKVPFQLGGRESPHVPS